MKKISIIIPCYNVEKYIGRALTSIEMQTIGMPAIEVICIDDCSTDSTMDILSAWEEKYPDSIMIVKLPKHLRQGGARNAGVRYASADYISFVDADDWIEPEYSEKLLDTALQGDFDVVQCELIRDFSEELVFSDDKASDGEMIEIRINSLEDRKRAFHEKLINNNPPRKLLRRKMLIDNDIFFTKGLAYEDSYWGVLLNAYYKSACIIKDKLYHYYVNQNSTSLKKNELYHVDLITNQIMLWEELRKRGFMSELKEEIEMEYLYSCALVFWKMLVLRYDEPPYSYYRLLCAVINEHIPDIMDNRYMKAGQLDEFHSLVFKSCIHVLSEDEFKEFAQNVKKAWTS